MQKSRVLIVDDDPIHLLFAAHCVADQPNFEVFTSASGREALGRLSLGEKFDVLLLDWEMPEVSGYDIVRVVHANPQLTGVKIMMITARSEMANIVQALEAGASEYLMKPFSKEMLLNKLALLGVIDCG